MQLRDEQGNLLVDLANVTNGLTVNGPAGTVTVYIDPATTTGLTFDTAAYDLKLSNGGTIADRLVQGTVTLSPQVTI